MTAREAVTVADVPVLLDVFERIRAGETKLADTVSADLHVLRKLALKKLRERHPRRWSKLKARAWTGKLGLVTVRVRDRHVIGVNEINYTCVWCSISVASLGLDKGVRITQTLHDKLHLHTAECALKYLASEDKDKDT